jgi:SsrA-binding protein
MTFIQAAQMKKPDASGRKIIAANKKAHFRFHILESYEAGIALTGSEVKSLRAGNAQITEAYARFRGGELFLVSANIGGYEKAGYAGHEPDRPRKLLLHKREISRLRAAVEEKGCTIVPLSLYFTRGLAKVEIAIAKGKKLHDRREDIKTREAAREMERAKRRRPR